jgi:hypothetical protein
MLWSGYFDTPVVVDVVIATHAGISGILLLLFVVLL